MVFYSFEFNLKFLIYRRSQFAPRQRLDQTSEELITDSQSGLFWSYANRAKYIYYG